MTRKDREVSFQVIKIQLSKLNGHRELCLIEMRLLKDAGMYAVVPSVIEDDRGGRNTYMQLLFPVNAQGGYDSPNGKRKFYIGCKKGRRNKALAMIERRRRYDALRTVAAYLEAFTEARERELRLLAAECARWTSAPHDILPLNRGDAADEFVVEDEAGI